MSENGGSPKERSWPKRALFHAAWTRAARSGTGQAARRGMQLRVVLLGLSAAGCVSAILCLVTGHAGMALRLFVATLVVLAGVLLQAVL